MTTSLLRQAAAAIILRPHPGDVSSGTPPAAAQLFDGLSHATIRDADRAVIGFDREGMQKVAALAEMLRKTVPKYRRGVGAAEFVRQIASIVAAEFEGIKADEIGEEHAAALEEVVEGWFRKEAVPRRHYVPCAISPSPSEPISVGPVTFVHLANFGSHPLGVPEGDFVDEFAMEQLKNAMKERYASWIAIVDIDGCERSRSAELADLAVDIAIGALQLVVELDQCRLMARISGRTSPPWRGNVLRENGGLVAGIQNLEAGRCLFGPYLVAVVERGKPVLDAAGKCLEGFLTGEGPIPKLRQAWCDAVYWFHEGLAEPLDSLAVAKLETAVEALLSTGSTSLSKQRMVQAIHAISGLGPKDQISGRSPTSVEGFVKMLVGARSRVLHGTVSTLLCELAPERMDLAVLVHDLLTYFAQYLEVYSQESSGDDAESRLAWAAARREAAAQAAAGAAR